MKKKVIAMMLSAALVISGAGISSLPNQTAAENDGSTVVANITSGSGIDTPDVTDAPAGNIRSHQDTGCHRHTRGDKDAGKYRNNTAAQDHTGCNSNSACNCNNYNADRYHNKCKH